MAVTKGLVLQKITTMRTLFAIIALAFVVMSCTTTINSNDDYGYHYDGAKLINYISENMDTVIWYDWSPAELTCIDGNYYYQDKPCVIDINDQLDIFAEMDELETIQWLNDNGQYSDTYYDMVSEFTPIWIESQQCFTLRHK